jgi:DNA-binding CsgD family transcriptional regulator
VRIHRLEHDSEELLVVSYPLQRPRAFARLSVREVDVVEAALAGLSRAAIAKRFCISPRTVANQLARAYAKLGVSGIAELSVLCSRSRSRARRSRS